MKTIARLLPVMLIATALAAPAHAVTQTGFHREMNDMTSSVLEGRQVIGMNGHRLGYILAVNDRTRMIELQTPGGIAVSLRESRLRFFGGDVLAPNTTRNDVLAMERRQTGHTVAMNIDMGRGGLRG